MYKVRIEPFGALVHHVPSCTTYEFTRKEARAFYPGPFPSHPKGIITPRIVHLELTSRCNMDPLCEYCYAHPNIDMNGELETDEWTQVLDKLSNSGVLQVTFGGGEPTLREDLLDLITHCKEVKMGLGMTTNGSNISDYLPYADRFDQINYSVHTKLSAILPGIYSMIHHHPGLATGLNILCKRDTIHDVLDDVDVLYDHYLESFKAGVKKIELLFLSFKPVTVEQIPNMMSRSEIMEIATEYHDRGISVAIDGHAHGTCEGGYSFCDISSTGEVYPCSFVRESYGNILEEPFHKIWARMPRIERCPYAMSGN